MGGVGGGGGVLFSGSLPVNALGNFCKSDRPNNFLCAFLLT